MADIEASDTQKDELAEFRTPLRELSPGDFFWLGDRFCGYDPGVVVSDGGLKFGPLLPGAYRVNVPKWFSGGRSYYEVVKETLVKGIKDGASTKDIEEEIFWLREDTKVIRLTPESQSPPENI